LRPTEWWARCRAVLHPRHRRTRHRRHLLRRRRPRLPPRAAEARLPRLPRHRRTGLGNLPTAREQRRRHQVRTAGDGASATRARSAQPETARSCH